MALLSTTALLNLFEVTGNARHVIECQRRPKSVSIHNKKLGTATIRDQIPLREGNLKRVLHSNTSPTTFYKLLNNRTFFWVDKSRLIRLLNAKSYKNKPHDVLMIKTESLLKKYETEIELCRINSGSTIYPTGKRGKSSFIKISEYPFKDYQKKYKKNALVELSVINGVSDIAKHVINVERWHGLRKITTIWANQKYSR